jgi:hypothetical protein
MSKLLQNNRSKPITGTNEHCICVSDNITTSQCTILTIAYLITYLVVTIVEKSGLNTGLVTGTYFLCLYQEVNKNWHRHQMRQVKVSQKMVGQKISTPIKLTSV